MENVKELVKPNKKIIMIVSALLVVIVVLIVGFIFLTGTMSKEKELKKLLEDMGREFYENQYYEKTKPTDEERREFIKSYSKLGIKINLNNLGRLDGDKLKEFVNPKTKEACDAEKSKVTIYPTEKYGKKDYKIEVELVCGFDKK